MAQQDLRCASMRTPPTTASSAGFLSRNGIAKKQSKIASPARRALKRNRLLVAELQKQAHHGGRNNRSKAVAIAAGDAACSDESDDAVTRCMGVAGEQFECDEDVKREVWECMLKREVRQNHLLRRTRKHGCASTIACVLHLKTRSQVRVFSIFRGWPLGVLFLTTARNPSKHCQH